MNFALKQGLIDEKLLKYKIDLYKTIFLQGNEMLMQLYSYKIELQQLEGLINKKFIEKKKIEYIKKIIVKIELRVGNDKEFYNNFFSDLVTDIILNEEFLKLNEKLIDFNYDRSLLKLKYKIEISKLLQNENLNFIKYINLKIYKIYYEEDRFLTFNNIRDLTYLYNSMLNYKE